MKRKSTSTVWRAIGAMCAVVLLISGVTFAALQSREATLKGSKITSATADLLISDGMGSYGAEAPGFIFENIEPGATTPMPDPGHAIYLQNNGSTKLSIRAALGANVTNNNNARMDRIYLKLTPLGMGEPITVPLSNLTDAYTNGQPMSLGFELPAGQLGQVLAQVTIASDAVYPETNRAEIENIDLIFSGTSVPQ